MSLGGIVAGNIRRLREERGLTQEELAARIRINRNYVGMIERQESSPTVAMLERIAKALGIEPARLFDEKAAGRKGGALPLGVPRRIANARKSWMADYAALIRPTRSA